MLTLLIKMGTMSTFSLKEIVGVISRKTRKTEQSIQKSKTVDKEILIVNLVVSLAGFNRSL